MALWFGFRITPLVSPTGRRPSFSRTRTPARSRLLPGLTLFFLHADVKTCAQHFGHYPARVHVKGPRRYPGDLKKALPTRYTSRLSPGRHPGSAGGCRAQGNLTASPQGDDHRATVVFSFSVQLEGPGLDTAGGCSVISARRDTIAIPLYSGAAQTPRSPPTGRCGPA
jgi:hypothetical protein